jgi:predicted ester cyclase
VSVASANKASFRRIPEVIYNTCAIPVASEVMLADYTEHIPLPSGYTPDRAGFVRFVEMWRTAVPDLTYTVTHFTDDDLIGDGDRVMHRVTGRGTHLGEMMGIPPTGKPLEWTELHIGRYADGMLVEHWGQIDVLRIMQDIGAMPGLTPPPPEVDPPAVEDVQPIGDDGLRALLGRYAEGRVDGLVHPDAVHLCGTALPPGPAGLDAELSLYRAAFPDLEVAVEDSLVEYPFVVGRLTAAGTHSGEFMGVPPTGRRVGFGRIDVLEVADGRIVGRWALADTLGLLAQLR